MIRQYQQDDNKAVRYVCHASSTTPAHKASLRLVCSLFCDFYLAQDKQYSFVATDEFDKPVGYVLCDVDFKRFASLYPTYIADVKKENPRDYRFTKKALKACDEIADDYPAHLQLNVLPSFQGRGIGRSLVDTAIARLRGEGVHGVHVVIKRTNTAAVAFFERLGFTSLLSTRKFFILGIKI